jgi:hypothetical protein
MAAWDCTEEGLVTIEARFELFGQPSELLVVEAVWASIEETGMTPTWAEAIDRVAEFADVDKAEAESRIVSAVLADEVLTRFLDEDHEWHLWLDEATSARVARRYMDMTLRRKSREETC